MEAICFKKRGEQGSEGSFLLWWLFNKSGNTRAHLYSPLPGKEDETDHPEQMEITQVRSVGRGWWGGPDTWRELGLR